MATQRKRHPPEQTAARPSINDNTNRHRHSIALTMDDDDDDDNSKQRKWKRRTLRDHTTIKIVFGTIVLVLLYYSFWLKRKRPLTTSSIVVLLFPNVSKSFSEIAFPQHHLISTLSDRGSIDPYHSLLQQKHHYGNPSDFRRRIHRHDEDHFNEERRQFLYDIDQKDETWASGFDEHIEAYHTCQPTSWKNQIFPVCNTFHELQRNDETDKLLGYVCTLEKRRVCILPT